MAEWAAKRTADAGKDLPLSGRTAAEWAALADAQSPDSAQQQGNNDVGGGRFD